MGNNYFKFKQFTIIQEKAAMKVGTDGVLLGSWADVQQRKNILDVGTGTGLIALMLAQRSNAQITAVELEEKAANEAKLNVNASLWKERVQVHNISFQQFLEQTESKFDLVVSNPPFFTNSAKAIDSSRTMARHTDTLSYAELIMGSYWLLNPEGRLAVILPFESSVGFEKLALESGLFLQRKTLVKPKPGKEVNRVLLSFGKHNSSIAENIITIYDENGQWTESYKNLTRNFYLYI